jgi:hypothetical protein
MDATQEEITIELDGETRHTFRVGDRFAPKYEPIQTVHISRIGKMGPTVFVSYDLVGPKGQARTGGTVGVHEAAERIERGEWARL